MTDADFTDDLALLTNASTQIESLMHSLEQAARGFDLYVNLDKTEFMCFNHEDAISSLNSKPLKLDQFTYLIY